MPNLQLLKAGDENEWRHVFDELHWDQRAHSAVQRWIGDRWPHYVEDVTSQALIKFVRAVSRCAVESRLLPLLLKISRDEAISFLRRAASREIATDQVPELPPEEVDNLKRLADAVSDALEHDAYDPNNVVSELAIHLNLNFLDQLILKEHVINGQTQAELAEETNIPEGTIARRKIEMLRRVRRFISGIPR
jgi:RNA polymerase sigma factor (sigma-70 family)